MRIVLLMLVFAFSAAPGCRQGVDPKPTPGAAIEVRGTLVAGAECPEVRTAAGKRYSLAGGTGAFKLGDEVCVRGKVAEVSFCMAGEATIAVESIAKASDCR